MPTYEYRCEKCLHEFEQFQRMTDRPLQRCPKCRGRVRRLISGGSCLIFKGSGFYINDYARKGSKASDDPIGVADPKKEKTPKEPAKKDNTKPIANSQ